VTPADELLAAADRLDALAADFTCDVDERCDHPVPCAVAGPLAAWLRVEARVERLDHSHALAVARAVNGGAA
jgi:hypothetical protein